MGDIGKQKLYRQEEGIIVGDVNLKDYITEYYKRLFGPRVHNSFSMDETLRDDIPQCRRKRMRF